MCRNILSSSRSQAYIEDKWYKKLVHLKFVAYVSTNLCHIYKLKDPRWLTIERRRRFHSQELSHSIIFNKKMYIKLQGPKVGDSYTVRGEEKLFQNFISFRFLSCIVLASWTFNVTIIIVNKSLNFHLLIWKNNRLNYLYPTGSDPLNPDYYSPVDFYIGAVIEVFKQRFKIIGTDMYVYRYMEANPSKFPCEVIENIRNHLYNKGYLHADVEDQVKEKLESERKYVAEREGWYNTLLLS